MVVIKNFFLLGRQCAGPQAVNLVVNALDGILAILIALNDILSICRLVVCRCLLLVKILLYESKFLLILLLCFRLVYILGRNLVGLLAEFVLCIFYVLVKSVDGLLLECVYHFFHYSLCRVVLVVHNILEHIGIGTTAVGFALHEDNKVAYSLTG